MQFYELRTLPNQTQSHWAQTLSPLYRVCANLVKIGLGRPHSFTPRSAESVEQYSSNCIPTFQTLPCSTIIASIDDIASRYSNTLSGYWLFTPPFKSGTTSHQHRIAQITSPRRRSRLCGSTPLAYTVDGTTASKRSKAAVALGSFHPVNINSHLCVAIFLIYKH